MWFGILTLATALIISVSAAYYSILGLTAIFAAAFWPIVILGSSLEVGKIVSTLWLHKYWHRAEIQYKIYLSAAVAILMVLTSMGVFGFLSKAHLDQAVPSGDIQAQVQIYDDKIKTQRDNIEAARKALRQMDEAVDQTMSRSNSEQGADKAANLRRSQARERGNLQNDISRAQSEITKLQEARAPIASQARQIEAEVGPIKYIAALIYGDNPDANLLEKAVRWVIILIVIVFDPLALTLLLAATKTFEWERKNQPEDDPDVQKFFGQAKQVAQSLDDGTYEPPVDLKPSANPTRRQQIFDSLESMWKVVRRPKIKDSEAEHAPLENLTSIKVEIQDVPNEQTPDPFMEDLVMAKETDEHDQASKLAERAWKNENPKGQLKIERHKLESGKIDRLPWDEPEFRARIQQETELVADNDPITGTLGEVRGFGISFPAEPKKGDMFLRVDQLPSILFKYNGRDWITVDKQLSDNYAYDDAYIDYLINKIASGEYDPDLLSDTESAHIEAKLKSKA
jgi:hypothetical protein